MQIILCKFCSHIFHFLIHFSFSLFVFTLCAFSPLLLQPDFNERTNRSSQAGRRTSERKVFAGKQNATAFIFFQLTEKHGKAKVIGSMVGCVVCSLFLFVLFFILIPVFVSKAHSKPDYILGKYLKAGNDYLYFSTFVRTRSGLA